MYPMSGTAKPHEGVVDSSLLLVQRMAAKLHRQFIARDTSSITASKARWRVSWSSSRAR